MATIELSLFDWRAVEARSDLDRFYSGLMSYHD